MAQASVFDYGEGNINLSKALLKVIAVVWLGNWVLRDIYESRNHLSNTERQNPFKHSKRYRI